MTERTLQTALKLAEDDNDVVCHGCGAQIPVPELVLLADEVHRLQKEVDGLKSGAFNAGIVMNLCGDVTHCNTCESAKDFH